jgi:hypothetical protein
VYCKDCNRYDLETRKCLDHKVNPQSWGQSVDVANVLGIRSICVFNDYRERLILSRARQADVLPGAKRPIGAGLEHQETENVRQLGRRATSGRQARQE